MFKNYIFFLASRNRGEVIKKHLPGLNLKPLSDTRWSSRIDAIKPLRLHLQAVSNALLQILVDWKNGFYRATFLPMKANDPDQFFKYTRMTVEFFDHLCKLLEGKLVKRRISDRICPEEKIAITLQWVTILFQHKIY
jgi:hypothetical protein